MGKREVRVKGKDTVGTGCKAWTVGIAEHRAWPSKTGLNWQSQEVGARCTGVMREAVPRPSKQTIAMGIPRMAV